MPTEIHGHAVMDLMQASGRTFCRKSLVAYIEHHFGRHTRFCTCSCSDLTAEQLVDFFAARGKFKGTEDAFTLDPGHACHH
ncbi:MAG: YecH family protein [Candidatus Didemnitutus sp.]|nr:YecH family protein [Candidatus Didemnitutus sp.]